MERKECLYNVLYNLLDDGEENIILSDMKVIELYNRLTYLFFI